MKYFKTLSAVFLVIFGLFMIHNANAVIGTPGGYDAPGRISFSATNVTTGAYTQIISAIPNAVKSLIVYNSGNAPIQIAVGSSGNEVGQLITPATTAAGTVYPIAMPAGARISIEAVGTTATTGEIEINAIYN